MPRSLYVTAALILSISATPAVAQLLDGAVGGGGPRSDVAAGIAMDADGNHFVTGTFGGTATFGGLSITAADDDPNSSWDDAFLLKYDADGEAVWARRGGTGIFNDFGNAVAVGPDGSVYWAGTFTALATFDGGDNDDGELQATSDFDAFVARYSASGDLLWVSGVRGSEQNTGQGLAVDANGNVYFVGLVRGTASIGAVTLQSAGSSDGFLVKLDENGEALWGLTLGGSQGNAAYDVDVHPDTGVIVAGQFRGVAVFGEIPLQSSGQTDAFAAHVDDDGAVLWAAKVGADGSEFTRGVAVASDGSVYLTGSFENDILVGSDILASSGFSDVFVVKLNPNGTHAWGRRIGGSSFDFGESVAVDWQDNVYATGYVNGSGTLSTGNGAQNFTTAGDDDAYLLVYSPAGELLSFELAGGTNRDRGTGVAISDDVGRLALAGWFRTSITIGDDTVPGIGGNDVFVAFGNTIAGGVATDHGPTPAGLTLEAFPNPLAAHGTVRLVAMDSQEIRIEIFDLLGRQVGSLFRGPVAAGSPVEVLLDAHLLPTGTYIVRVAGETVRLTRRITIVR
jgi:hypothetical protein